MFYSFRRNLKLNVKYTSEYFYISLGFSEVLSLNKMDQPVL